jgi:hypothetical protein
VALVALGPNPSRKVPLWHQKNVYSDICDFIVDPSLHKLMVCQYQYWKPAKQWIYRYFNKNNSGLGQSVIDCERCEWDSMLIMEENTFPMVRWLGLPWLAQILESDTVHFFQLASLLVCSTLTEDPCFGAGSINCWRLWLNRAFCFQRRIVYQKHPRSQLIVVLTIQHVMAIQEVHGSAWVRWAWMLS